MHFDELRKTLLTSLASPTFVGAVVVMIYNYTVPMQSVPTTTNVLSSNPTQTRYT
jgi:hypothetical protein